LKKVVAKYQGQVTLAYRDFPMSELHPQAQIAAEASRCASEQGKFWEYHDLLFESFGTLPREDLIEAANKLHLDTKQFDSCLTSGKYKSQIDRDFQEGLRAGVFGTPGFFINGIFLAGAQPATAFEKIIDEELESAKRESARN
jgi:protein-disulfide isomerase